MVKWDISSLGGTSADISLLLSFHFPTFCEIMIIVLMIFTAALAYFSAASVIQPQSLPLANQNYDSINSVSINASPPSINLPSSASNFSLSTDLPLTCFIQNPTSAQRYRPIVLEDCYKIFSDILLVPRPLVRTLYTSQKVHRRQNGNCIFQVYPSNDRVPSRYFSAYQIGVASAKIVQGCVTSATEYLGGRRELELASGWIAQVVADGPR